ncbi:MAG: glycogen/starch synthase [Bacillota bacterium]
MEKKLSVLIIASEAGPYIKSGGLGDVIGSLPQALKNEGVDVRVVLPRYRDLKETHLAGVEYLEDITVGLGWREHTAKLLVKKDTIPTYFIENDYYFGRPGLYGYGDDNERFAFFSKAALEMLEHLDFYPDIIHCNDWQTGPVCMYLKELYSKTVYYSEIRTLFTIHNIQYQGDFPKEAFEALGVPPYCYGNTDFNNRINYLKMALVYADAISTVSETYAEEIQDSGYGYGMEGLLRNRNHVLSGVLNGIDTITNDPKRDERIPNNYSVNNLEGKRRNKIALQEELGLEQRPEAPIVGMITRLADQKGLDLLQAGFHEMMKNDVQFILIGTGEHRFESFFREMENSYPGRVCANIFFDEHLAQRIYSGSDMFLMPSRFEPCGLGQMFSLRYGTIPIARKTGGLADTIKHYDPETKKGNGFLFETYDVGGMLWAINEALQTYYKSEEDWEILVKNALQCDFSMESMATKYISLFKEILHA